MKPTAERVLDVAENLFAARGYKATTLGEIARVVGIRSPSLYNHFRSKAALYQSVLERLIGRFGAPLRELQEGAITRARIRAWQAQIVRMHIENPNLARLVQHEALSRGPGARAITEGLFRPLIASSASAAAGRQPRGGAHEKLQPWIVMGFNNIVMSYVTMAPLYRDLLGIEPLCPAAAERQVEFITRLTDVFFASDLGADIAGLVNAIGSSFPVHVERLADDEYQLRWSEEFSTGPVRVRAHTDADGAADAAPLVHDARGGTRLARLAGARHYFHLETGHGTQLIAAQRDVPLEGGTNFRDLGGYRSADGRRVRWGRLFRSGHSAGLTERDRASVAALGIAVCCDFRRDEERRIEQTRLPAATRVIGMPIDPGSIGSFFERINAGEVGPARMSAFMEQINREFARAHAPTYRRMFEELLALEQGAFMINCAAGKDRTGFGAAMILAALGVCEQDIVADYLLSARYFPIERELARVQRKYGGTAERPLDIGLLMPMLETRETYLRAALETIRTGFDGIDSYLQSMLGIGAVERRELRERFTTPW